MQDAKVKKLAMAGVMAAMICVLTIFPHIPLGSGYIHLGDGLILLAVMLLGPLGIPAAAVGSMLADLLVYPVYAPVTLVVKGLMAAVAWLIYRKNDRRRTVLAFIAAEAVMVLGYFAYEWIAVPEFALADVPGNLIQAVAGVCVGLVLTTLVPRLESLTK
ncbi:MAG: ECF transporter S component [Clostridia bacterium]|nr:ECF transporter S component [Clostridia bacterium]